MLVKYFDRNNEMILFWIFKYILTYDGLCRIRALTKGLFTNRQKGNEGERKRTRAHIDVMMCNDVKMLQNQESVIKQEYNLDTLRAQIDNQNDKKIHPCIGYICGN